jgi:hypothetical protein
MKSDCVDCERKVDCLTQGWSFCPKLEKKLLDLRP